MKKASFVLHTKSQLVRLHGVEFSHDSISGIPWLEHLSCDTCRVRYALADVTGLRKGDPGSGAWFLLGPILAVTFWFISWALSPPDLS